ncbi:MAG: nickel pincer cofactor biosynthesis protein LarC [Nocardioidaceae bacterium]
MTTAASTRIGWLDCSSGASGDMLLGALAGAGVPIELMERAACAVAPEPVTITLQQTTRNGLAATRAVVDVADSVTHRTWVEVRALLEAADLPDGVRRRAIATFTRLAVAEAAVHATTPERIRFHEVGALDAITDIVGVCAGLEYLALEALTCSTVALGSGTVRAAHGELPVPPPAVVHLLRGVPTMGGPVAMELCTPTGAALIAEAASGYGPQPPMSVTRIGVGAGGQDPDRHANIVRLLLGEPVASGPVAGEAARRQLQLDTNVDDLDPRLWPPVLTALLDAGAADAWLTPILMKKGRPAYTLSVLCPVSARDAVVAVVVRQTTAIGLRTRPVDKVALERREERVLVDGQPIRVKVATHNGAVVNVQPEYDDVVRAAGCLNRPAKIVLAQAAAAAHQLW